MFHGMTGLERAYDAGSKFGGMVSGPFQERTLDAECRTQRREVAFIVLCVTDQVGFEVET